MNNREFRWIVHGLWIHCWVERFPNLQISPAWTPPGDRFWSASVLLRPGLYSVCTGIGADATEQEHIEIVKWRLFLAVFGSSRSGLVRFFDSFGRIVTSLFAP